MSRIVFVNGEFVPYEDAKVSIMDRGFLFADGIYEVAAVLDGKLVDNEAHLARLVRCLGEIGIRNPYSIEEWTKREEELVARNNVKEGLVYMEVTRGVWERDFPFPPETIAPTVVMFTQEKNITGSAQAETGAKIITVPDLRWKRRDIKSVALLAQVLAKQEAAKAKVSEAWMVEEGYVTEGGSSTAFIITKDGKIVTRPLSTAILPGITRQAVLRLSEENGLTLEERLFTVEEALDAAEAFYTSATAFVMPAVQIDDVTIGDGKPGPLTRRLRALYIDMAKSSNSGRMGAS